MHQCSKCGFENPEGMKFCGNCGAALAGRCSRCGAENPAPFKFCGQCGGPLHSAEAAEPHPPTTRTPSESALRITSEQTTAAPNEERKMVTALFADIKG